MFVLIVKKITPTQLQLHSSDFRQLDFRFESNRIDSNQINFSIFSSNNSSQSHTTPPNHPTPHQLDHRPRQNHPRTSRNTLCRGYNKLLDLNPKRPKLLHNTSLRFSSPTTPQPSPPNNPSPTPHAEKSPNAAQ